MRSWASTGVEFGDSRLPDRFWSKVCARPNGCWQWVASIRANGYGRFNPPELPGPVGAHRYAFEALVDVIEVELVIDHLCRNRACVNPAHMEVVTRAENVMRGVGPAAENSRKTHCPQGHRYDEDNTYVRPRGSRECRACTRARKRRGGNGNGSTGSARLGDDQG